jgi:hypothetical protein
MMRFLFCALCFLVSALLPVPLFTQSRRLVANALLGMVNIELPFLCAARKQGTVFRVRMGIKLGEERNLQNGHS